MAEKYDENPEGTIAALGETVSELPAYVAERIFDGLQRRISTNLQNTQAKNTTEATTIADLYAAGKITKEQAMGRLHVDGGRLIKNLRGSEFSRLM